MAQSQSPQVRVDKDTFVDRVRTSGLVSPDRLAKALKQVPDIADRGRVVARLFVDMGLLTKFQAERLLVGRTDGFVVGQYRVLDELGRGGMGRVFKAEHMTMGRVVALKILSTALTKTERARQMFEREVRAAARLSHPNIVTAFDANQLGDRCFLVMEFVDGPNLHELVNDRGPLPIAQACDCIRQAALGLQYAHDLGMVHRDIKPANLLIQQSKGNAGASNVKILDFGLARLHAREEGTAGVDSIVTSAQSVMGTPDFLSPEQARNLHATDGRSDLYSLGCTFYYLLTGQVPFPGGTTMEKLVRQSTENAKPVSQLRNEIPYDVESIVQKLMAKNPGDRFQSATELAAALLPYCNQESANWIAADPLPADNVLPVSSRSLPRIVPTPGEDPWANIDDESAMEATLAGEAATTSVGSRPGRRAQPASNGTFWYVLASTLLLGLGTAVFFTLRHFIAK